MAWLEEEIVGTAVFKEKKKLCALLYFCRDYSNIYFQKDALCSRIIKGPPMYKDSLIPFSTKF